MKYRGIFTIFLFVCQSTLLFGQIPTDRITCYLKTEKGGLARLSKGSVKIISKRITLRPQDRIELLIRHEKFDPNDPDIYGLIYSLNPNVSRLDSVSNSIELNVPSVAVTNFRLGIGALITLHLDEDIKSKIQKNFVVLNQFIKRDTSVSTINSGDTADLKYWGDLILSIRQINAAIQARTTYTSLDRLEDIVISEQKLEELTSNKTDSSKRIQLKTIGTNLMFWAKDFSEEKGDQNIPANDINKVNVTISIKSNGLSKLISEGYQVYYCAPGLEPEGAHPIGSTKTPITFPITPANWTFWAKRAPVKNAYPADSDEIQILVGPGNLNQVDLTLLK